jgi:hypothetical protein
MYKKYRLERRGREVASAKTAVLNTTKKSGRFDILRESLSLSLDRKTARAIHKAKKDAQKEGNMVSLRSLIK